MKLVEIISAMLTPIIAVVTAYIMIQQFRMEKRNSRYQLFNHRNMIYESTLKFISGIIQNGTVKIEECQNFLKETRSSKIFFKDDINDYLNEIYRNAINLWQLNAKSEKMPVSKERNDIIDKEYLILECFSEELKECNTKFLPYLNFKTP